MDDDRESVSYRIMDLLTQAGADVDYNDPFIPKVGNKREFKHFLGKQSVDLKMISAYDMTVILTDHSQYNYAEIVQKSTLVVDTRNACRHSVRKNNKSLNANHFVTFPKLGPRIFRVFPI